jgi:hypothetical protein
MRLPFLALGVALAMPAAADQPLRVTTDTPEYCGLLAQRLSSLAGAEQDAVRGMAEEGLRLCHTGHIRTGIAKLRRALRAVQAQRE